MADFVIDAKSFYSRMGKLYESWKSNKASVWGEADAVVVLSGTREGEAEDRSSLLQLWLLGYEFPETVILLTSSTIYFYSSPKKTAILESLKTSADRPHDAPAIEILVKQPKVDNSEKIRTLVEAAKAAGSKLGVLAKEFEKQTGTFADELRSRFRAIADQQEVDVTSVFTEIMAAKDETELEAMKEAGMMTSRIFRKVAYAAIEDIVDKGEKVKHTQLGERITAAMEDLSIADPRKKDAPRDVLDQYEAGFGPFIQSGGEFDLSFAGDNTDRPLSYDTIVVVLGEKFKSYNGFLARTILVDETKEQRRMYEALEKAMEVAVKGLRSGRRLEEVHAEVMAAVQEYRPEALPYFSKNIGFGIGLEVNDRSCSIKKGNTRVIRPGMCLVVKVAVENVEQPKAKDPKRRKYSMMIADTVSVSADPEVGAEVLTKVSYKYSDMAWSIADEAEAAPSAAASSSSSAKEKSAKQVVDVDYDDFSMDAPRRSSRPKKEKKTAGRSEDERRELIEAIFEARAADPSGSSRKQQSSAASKKNYSVAGALAEGAEKSYRSAEELPKDLQSSKIYVDARHETVLFPINGVHVPFHVATIKNASIANEGSSTSLRVNFFAPGAGVTSAYIPSQKYSHKFFVKELSFRSGVSTGLQEISKKIAELKKKVTQREQEKREQADLVQQASLQVSSRANIARLGDVNMKPGLKGKKTVGDLEAHVNGLRFVPRGASAENVDVLYSNIRYCIYQPADKETQVLIHLNLRNPIMVGKKKTHDVQFYTEVIEEYEQIVGRNSRRNLTDEEAIEEEERERELKDRLNKEFLEFAKKVETKSQGEIEVDIPFMDKVFAGTPAKSSTLVYPTANCFVSLVEQPFLVVPCEDVEIAQFERVAHGLRNFDLAFVFKDYTKTVMRINAIPMEALDIVKDALLDKEIPFFEGSANIEWNAVLKQIREDPDWQPWGRDGWRRLDMNQNSDDEEVGEDGEGGGGGGGGLDDDSDSPTESEYAPTSSEDEASESEADSDDDDDFDSDDDDSDASEDLDSSEEEGLDWDELEEKAAKDDKRRGWSDDEDGDDGRKRKRAPPPPAKGAAGKGRR